MNIVGSRFIKGRSGTENMTDYRTRIYKEYASRMQNVATIFDEVEAVRWGRAYDTFLKGWLPEKNVAILDVACGGGNLLHFFKTRGYADLQGVDVSPEQVALSKQVTENITEANTIDYLVEKQQSYDLITGLDIIEHFQKSEVLKFLDASYGALKPGGRIILQTPNAGSPWGMMVRYGDFTHEVAFGPNSLKQLLSLCGFSEIESRETGPVIHGVLSLGRFLIWKIIRVGLAIWNLSETGGMGSGIYTRTFLISGRKVTR